MLDYGIGKQGFARAGVIFILILSLGGCMMNSDVSFARRVFYGLAKGRASVAEMIDWSRFKAMGQDVAADYARARGKQGRAIYRKAFIANFALGFESVGAKVGTFRNWRIYKIDKDKSIVAVNSRGGQGVMLLLTVARQAGGRRKLVAIDWGGEN